MRIRSRIVGVLSVAVLTGLLSLPAIAQQQESVKAPPTMLAYRYYKDITVPVYQVPTVVEVPLNNDFLERFDFALFDNTSLAFEPVYFREVKVPETPVLATSSSFDNAAAMTDGNVQTYTQFLMPERGVGSVTISLVSPKPITTIALTMLLDNFVARPLTAELRAMVDGQDQIVVARSALTDGTIRFLKTTSSQWTLSLTYGQPLRITELHFYQEGSASAASRIVRFLVQPGHTSYRLYFGPDRYAPIVTRESGNLSVDAGVKRISGAGPTTDNPGYTMADDDNDGVPDVRDNCVRTSNTDQKDVDGNGRGDVCDDFDRDGRINSLDNCPDLPNAGQADVDADGIGDICDGQESRVTEKYTWLPWVGIGFAGVVLVLLFALTIRSMKKDGNLPPTEPPQA